MLETTPAAAPLTADESDTLLRAMLDMAEEGDEEALDTLAELAADPAKFREAMGGAIQTEQEGGDAGEPAKAFR